ncbi:hypothetical protein BT63DRAFT_456676 [Microthyrium microscopicum]|uniref:Uncharacterized protein n=1 Tax=Microthyrium microscopicum TaxID=703497 RepID=A0A6A6U5F0_9PEZI|nr:hypothetical protein BT63DRAFT_456676 [Microthyrium microscopicum]
MEIGGQEQKNQRDAQDGQRQDPSRMKVILSGVTKTLQLTRACSGDCSASTPGKSVIGRMKTSRPRVGQIIRLKQKKDATDGTGWSGFRLSNPKLVQHTGSRSVANAPVVISAHCLEPSPYKYAASPFPSAKVVPQYLLHAYKKFSRSTTFYNYSLPTTFTVSLNNLCVLHNRSLNINQATILQHILQPTRLSTRFKMVLSKFTEHLEEDSLMCLATRNAKSVSLEDILRADHRTRSMSNSSSSSDSSASNSKASTPTSSGTSPTSMSKLSFRLSKLLTNDRGAS